MPWDAKSFRAKHNKKLNPSQAAKGARVATAMVEKGVPEGIAIATGNARAEGKPMKSHQSSIRSDIRSAMKRVRS